MKRFVRPKGFLDAMEQIQKTRVDRPRLSGSKVSQDMIDVGQRFGDMTSVCPIGCPELLAGMKVIKG